MRPGNDFSGEIFERLIDELDARIQHDVAKKLPSEVIRLIPDEWVAKSYKKGERVHVRVNGKINVFTANKDVDSQVSPLTDTETWTATPFETYVVYPYDRLYVYYIIAQMDFVNGDYNKYANDNELFSNAYNEFARWWQRNYRLNKEGYDAVRLKT